jgi:hypothetical protein
VDAAARGLNEAQLCRARAVRAALNVWASTRHVTRGQLAAAVAALRVEGEAGHVTVARARPSCARRMAARAVPACRALVVAGPAEPPEQATAREFLFFISFASMSELRVHTPLVALATRPRGGHCFFSFHR